MRKFGNMINFTSYVALEDVFKFHPPKGLCRMQGAMGPLDPDADQGSEGSATQAGGHRRYRSYLDRHARRHQ